MDKKKYLITAVAGALIALGIAFLSGLASAENTGDVLRTLCDGCFVSGALIAALGGLLFADNDGQFDLLFFGLKKASKAAKKDKEEETFREYRYAKHARRNRILHLLLVGGGYLLLSGILLACYYLL